MSELKINKSAEDYLEAMLMLKEEKGYVRSVDIADDLHVTKPSVSYAVKRLRENGYLTMDHSGFITLTDKGLEIAEKIYTRHKTLTKFFISLGVNPEVALEDACKVEHDLSDETFSALCRHAEAGALPKKKAAPKAAAKAKKSPAKKS